MREKQRRATSGWVLVGLVPVACLGRFTEGTATEGTSSTSSTSGAASGGAGTSTSATTAATDGSESGSAGSTTGEPIPQGPPPAEGKNPYPWSTETNDVTCKDGADNDDNGYIDCDDFTCSRNPAVIVCGGLAIYESSPARCANGQDDDGDGKADCADPDCRKNAFLNVCVQPRSESECGTGVDGDGDGHVDCDDFDCVIDDPSCTPPPGSLRILFDLTLDETAAAAPNSDWVVDPWGRLPVPSNPLTRGDWDGALSSFAFALHQQGHRIETLTAWGGALTNGDGKNPQDLSKYDVLVVIEPSRPMASAEKSALLDFVAGGGGLLMIANHVSADRDGNGWSAVGVFNDLFDDNPQGPDPFGFRFDEVDVDILTPLTRVEAPTHPVIKGPNGVVDKIGLYVGSTAHLTGKNAGAQGLILTDDAPNPSSGIIIGAASVGAGRVVFGTDSAMLGDGTDSHGTNQPDHDSWNAVGLDHQALFLNAIAWLGG